MLRTFAEHCIRHVHSLDGIWELVVATERTDDGPLPAAYNRRLLVPGAWETLPGLEDYRGRGWLRRRIEVIGDAAALRLVFGGISHTAEVYLDGESVGTHYDAFTPFELIVPDVAPGSHELVVAVDNSFGDHSALHIPNDYYTYGGITRPAAMELLSGLSIGRLHATPVHSGEGWSLDLSVHLRNLTGEAQSPTLHAMLGDGLAAASVDGIVVAPDDTAEVRLTLANLEIQPWSPEQPTLYDLAIVVTLDDEAVDDLIDRVGFRVLAIEDRQLLLNGEPIRPQGVNRHEDHPQFGCAIPVEAMVQDLYLLRDLGANFVRTCHYPNDQRFLDLCDELGFYVWEESHARTVDFNHPHFREQIETSTREMVAWHYNHPSIIIWGCLNECDSVSEAGRGEHERVLKLLKELDATRPVTFASDKRQRDLCLDLVDIVSWNLYGGWYSGKPDAIEPALDGLLAWLDSDESRGGAGKPVILSEFGAGAIYGNRQRCRSKWSEEYQAAALDEALRVYLGRPEVVGTAIWQFCDVRICGDGNWWYGRPRTMNNKGIVDEYRRPKLAYDSIRRRFRGDPQG